MDKGLEELARELINYIKNDQRHTNAIYPLLPEGVGYLIGDRTDINQIPPGKAKIIKHPYDLVENNGKPPLYNLIKAEIPLVVDTVLVQELCEVLIYIHENPSDEYETIFKEALAEIQSDLEAANVCFTKDLEAIQAEIDEVEQENTRLRSQIQCLIEEH